MDTIDLIANLMVGAGALVMLGSVAPVRALMALLATPELRRRWMVMAALIGLFLLGYVGYMAAFWNRHQTLLDLIVPAVFLGGAGFVWLTARLSLQTAVDMLRVSRLERESLTDALTGVHNRRYLDSQLGDELGLARRYGFPLAVIFLDIDHFKRVNDNHGHPVGDAVLKSFASALGEALRKTDLLARYGGEEFVVVSPHTDLAGATLVAQRLRQAVEALRLDAPGTPGALRITCSAGVAELTPNTPDAQQLLDAADRNLYRAKQQGRNRVVAGAEPADDARAA